MFAAPSSVNSETGLMKWGQTECQAKDAAPQAVASDEDNTLMPQAAPASPSPLGTMGMNVAGALPNVAATGVQFAIGTVFGGSAGESLRESTGPLHLAAGTDTGGQGQPTQPIDTGPPRGPTGPPAGRPPVYKPPPQQGGGGSR